MAGTPLSDQKGNAVGVMTDDSFVENTGETINAYSRDTLTLYFASEDGTHPVSYTHLDVYKRQPIPWW